MTAKAKSTLERKKPVRDPYLALASTVAKHRSRLEKLKEMCTSLEQKLAIRRAELIAENEAFHKAEDALTGRTAREDAEDEESDEA